MLKFKIFFAAMSLCLFSCITTEPKIVKSSALGYDAKIVSNTLVKLEKAKGLEVVSSGEVQKWIKNGQKVTIQLQLLSITASQSWWDQEEFFSGAEIDLRVWLKEDNGAKSIYVASNEGFEVIPISRENGEQVGRQYALFVNDQVETNDSSISLNIVAMENDQIILPSARQKLAKVLDGAKEVSLAAIEKKFIKVATPMDSVKDSLSIIWLIPSLIIDGIDAITEKQPFLSVQLNLARSIFYRPFAAAPETVEILNSEYRTNTMGDFATIPMNSSTKKLDLDENVIKNIEYVRHVFTLNASGMKIKFGLMLKRNEQVNVQSN
ncbi:hypothetical protein EHQ76_07120 [Leptospira barantonii]|uniref:Lipoprotein n=1 Tax=Leptospira barantonii TaxID=2023184 RepID=A0A5F2BH69_9LEPT|nr:hypothetical protein [Leptospira barantonii]TGM04812.1 hypothetical protein EHQ76_07120 [Leptospira barantonii]